MANREDIDKRLISKIPFKNHEELEEFLDLPRMELITVHNIDRMPPWDPDEQRKKLRQMLYSIFHDKLEGNYDLLEVKCDIKRDTFQKILRAQGGRGISRTMLAKFVVGAGLDESTADELFLCQGAGLDRRSRFDYILMCAIHDKDDLAIFDEMLVTYGCKSVLSKPD